MDRFVVRGTKSGTRGNGVGRRGVALVECRGACESTGRERMAGNGGLAGELERRGVANDVGARCRRSQLSRPAGGKTRTGRPLGSDEFMESCERHCGRALRPQKRGPKAKSDAPEAAVLAMRAANLELW